MALVIGSGVTFTSGVSILPEPPPALGDAYLGGFYAGDYILGGVTYNLIVAPKATGETQTKWKSVYTGTGVTGVTASLSVQASDGKTVTDQAYAGGSSPAANWVKGLTIGGYTDWYIPSVWELCQAYATFKPSTRINYTGNFSDNGSNPYTTTPGWPANTLFTTTNPPQTAFTDWRTGGAQAFAIGSADSAAYGTTGRISNAFSQIVYFDNNTAGGQTFSEQSVSTLQNDTTITFRAMRKVPK